MARPPRFQRKRSRGRRLPRAAGGFVNQVRDAMSQIQQDLEEAAAEAKGAQGTVSRDAADVSRELREIQRAARNLPAKLRQDMMQKARSELKRRLTGAGAGERPRARHRPATRPPRPSSSIEGASLEGSSLEGTSLEGSSLEGASLESGTLEGATLEGAMETDIESPARTDPQTGESPLLRAIRQTMASPLGIQQAWIFSEILGKPPGLR